MLQKITFSINDLLMQRKRIVIITIILIGVGVMVSYLLLFKRNNFFKEPATLALIRSLPYYVDPEGWTLILEGKTDGQNSLSFEKNVQDTAKHIIFSVDDKRQPAKVIRFTKEFKSDDGNVTLKLDSKDTIVAYLVTHSNDTIFYKGEYFFKYTHFQMDTAERKFYLLYKDSLKAVSGDNLPRLPSLSANERATFKKIIK
jgi:hypothetical protein